MRTLTLAAVLMGAAWIPFAASRAETPLQSAAFAWDRGDYVSALTTYLDVLDGTATPAELEAIALQTGELFHTTEITTDGAAPLFSPEGGHIAYETGTVPAVTTRIIRASDLRKPVAELQGFRGVFSPDGSQFAYLKVTATPAIRRAAEAVDVGPANERNQRIAALNAQVGLDSTLAVRDVRSGRETVVDTGRLRKDALAFTAGGLLVLGAPAADGDAQFYRVGDTSALTALTSGDGDSILCGISSGGAAVTFTARRARGGRTAADQCRSNPAFGVLTVADGKVRTVDGSAPAFSADGSTLAFITSTDSETRLVVAPVGDPAKTTIVRRGSERLDAPAFSPDGRRIAFQIMPKEDWEIFVIGRDGSGETPLTREIQHDLMPQFIGPDRLIAMMGEARHRRSQLYDLTTGKRIRLFHNNTVRTIAPEYAWVPSPDGTRLLVVAERDGNTVSPERGVYLVDLSRRITAEALRARVAENLAAEQALRAKTERIFTPIAADVRAVVAAASVGRVYSYEKALFDFDSKHITRPGNKLAGEYLFAQYKAFGYEPEYQWFAGRNALGGQTANVLATLKGTVNPELVYVVSSHYDSVAAGPGADDDSSGTAALLETARLLAKHPQPATIVFASFTGEEAGLLGSREYVRRAVENKVRIVGALNNDMIGWANDHRLDNTIRYSNPGIRDIQHGAAMHFTDLITYDALYYKSTDAAAYYEAYGDIVGGIGSYPVLGNPHYHQPHDVLETINHRLVTEVAKTTAATLMLLASSPSRLGDLTVKSFSGGAATLSWRPGPERGITGYIVAYGPASNPEARQTKVTGPTVTLTGVTPGTVVSVKAVNAKGLEGWDWARVTVN